MNQKKFFSVRNIAKMAIFMALYASLTLALTPISFGAIQVRISELFVLLCFYNPIYCFSITMGCFIANCFSPLGYVDMIFGTLATLIACLGIYFIKNIWIGSGVVVLANALIVGAELSVVYQSSFWIMCLQVGVGEMIAIFGIGIPILMSIRKTTFFKNLVNYEDRK